MADFVSPSLLVPALRDDLNLRTLETLSARASELDLASVVVYDFDAVDSSALLHLAEQFNILGDAGWDMADTDAKKRALLKEATALHRIKGTPFAVKRSLELLGVNATLTEWWQSTPQGTPHTFSIHAQVTDQQDGLPAIDQERVARIYRAITFWKRASSHFVMTVGVGIATELVHASIFSGTTQMITQGDLRGVSIESEISWRQAGIFSTAQLLNGSGEIKP